jgi:hypothetical protein
VHDKILIGENLMKRGFHGPFICPLCQIGQENINHLFWECSFARKCWTLAFGDLARNIRWPSSPHPSLGNWDKYCRGYFKDKPALKRIWRAMPKFICWQIWITRNRNFFQGKASLPQTKTAKAKLLLSESINSKPLKIEDSTKQTA